LRFKSALEERASAGGLAADSNPGGSFSRLPHAWSSLRRSHCFGRTAPGKKQRGEKLNNRFWRCYMRCTIIKREREGQGTGPAAHAWLEPPKGLCERHGRWLKEGILIQVPGASSWNSCNSCGWSTEF